MTDPIVNSRQLSIKINEVLNRLSVNDEMRRERRIRLLQLECFEKVFAITKLEVLTFGDTFNFGSQIEGTTTLGLNSDTDRVTMLDNIVVITDKKDDNVSKDMYTFLMDKFTNKGYCCLRDISFHKETDVVKFWKKFFTEEYRRDNYLKNSFHIIENVPGIKTEREGPAFYYRDHDTDCNYLHGFYCSSWPREVSNTFLLNQEKNHWPSDQLLQDVLQSRCFVVPKGSDTGPDSDIEWRLSFTFGERLLMFDLNIVQIRCYVLMKFIKTTFLDNLQDCKGIISSYICKTVLFHTVSQTNKSEWVEEELLLDLNRCLSNLQKCIDQKNCPHFIMPLNNLLENKLNEAKRFRLLDELKRIIESNGRVLLDIEKLLRGKHVSNDIEHEKRICNALYTAWTRAFQIVNMSTVQFNKSVRVYEVKMKKLQKVYQTTPKSDETMHDVIKIFVGIYSTLIGSLLASDDIKNRHDLSDKAFQWFLLGMTCIGKATAHLKLASVLFLIGDFDSTFIILKDIEKEFDELLTIFVPICKGNRSRIPRNMPRQNVSSQNTLKQSYSELLRLDITSCVIYSIGEIDCCPKELQYEFFRAAFNEKQKGHVLDYKWLICAIIPQVPFFYFMQYKLYKKLEMMEECYQSLVNLTIVSQHKELCTNHRETVNNLMGQCMEQEGHYILALHYYYKSLQVEPTYNAAKILICCNLCQQLHRDKMS